MSSERESQTQDASSSGAEVDEYAITRKVLSKKQGHVRGIGRKVKGVCSTSFTASLQSTFGPRDFPCVSPFELAAWAEAKRANARADVCADSMRCLIAHLQSQMPHLQFLDNLLPQDDQDEDTNDNDVDLGDL